MSFILLCFLQISFASSADPKKCEAHLSESTDFQATQPSPGGEHGLRSFKPFHLDGRTHSLSFPRDDVRGTEFIQYNVIQYNVTRESDQASSSRELGLHQLTGAIDANQEIAREFLNTLIAYIRSTPDHNYAFVMLDLNDLGVVNYFPGEMETGDDYIRTILKRVREKIRPSDLIFRIGGDEFVIVMQKIKVENLTKRLQSISDAVYECEEGREIIARGEQLLETKYGKSEMSDAELGAYIKVMTMRPSISIGSKLVGPNDTFETLLRETNKQANFAKLIYKIQRGDAPSDLSKYQMSPEMAERIKNLPVLGREARPTVLEAVK